ncbi:CD1375 family protein [Clostridium sp.]|nr:CD1375 family protein [Clostridium sp.]
MVAIYVRRINEGIMTIDKVPTLWRDKVAASLATQ